MKCIFLDTVGILALYNRSDQWHASAEAAMNVLLQTPCRFVTGTAVLLECGNSAARTAIRDDIADLRDELFTHGNLLVATVQEEAQAWSNYRQHEGNNAGIVDCLSFVLMRRLGITAAFSNDDHFRAAGFETLF